MIFLQSFLLWLLVLKYTRLHVLKNKKIRKKFIYKNRETTAWYQTRKRGWRYSKTYMHTNGLQYRHDTVVSRLYCTAFAYDTLSKDRNCVFAASRGACALFVFGAAYLSPRQIRAKKTAYLRNAARLANLHSTRPPYFCF